MPATDDASLASIEVDLFDEHGAWSAVQEVEALVRAAAAAVSIASQAGLSEPSTVTVALSSDDAVAVLNGEFRGKAKPTNVLSFPAGPGAEPGHLGDIVLAFETVAREAAESGTPLAHHVQHLVVHGLLHLLGFDHDRPDTAEEMEQLEIAILNGLGIANPYTGELETGT